MEDRVRLNPGEAVRFMVGHSGLSYRAVSRLCGRASSWASVVGTPSRDPSLSAVCRVAEACGFTIALMDAEGRAVAFLEAPGDEVGPEGH